MISTAKFSREFQEFSQQRTFRRQRAETSLAKVEFTPSDPDDRQMSNSRRHCSGTTHSAEGELPVHYLNDFFSGALPAVGLFAHAENMESMVSYPKGDAVYLRRGRADVETCQAGFRANLVGTVALAGAGILSAIGLVGAAMPVAGLGVTALAVSGATNAFTRREIDSVSR